MATATSPFLADLGLQAARALLDRIPAGPASKPDLSDGWITVPAAV